MPRIARLAAVSIYIHAAENQALLRAKWSEYNERD